MHSSSSYVCAIFGADIRDHRTHKVLYSVGSKRFQFGIPINTFHYKLPFSTFSSLASNEIPFNTLFPHIMREQLAVVIDVFIVL